MEFNQPKVLELNAKKHVNMFAMLLIDKFIHFVAFYWRPQIATEYTLIARDWYHGDSSGLNLNLVAVAITLEQLWMQTHAEQTRLRASSFKMIENVKNEENRGTN